MVVPRSSDGRAEQPLIIIYRLNDGAQQQQKLCIFIGCFPGREKVCSGIRGEGPVVVLAAAVDTGKGLFMKQAHQTMLCSYLLHDFHGQLVLVGGNVSGGINRSQFMLCGSHFVVLRLCQNAQLPQFLVQFFHIGRHAWLDRAEIVVIQFLALGRLGTEQGPAGIN